MSGCFGAWLAELTNGDLIRMAEGAGFDVMITTDRSIRYQQNLAGRRLAFVVIDTNDWTRIRHWRSVVVDALSEVPPGPTGRSRFHLPD